MGLNGSGDFESRLGQNVVMVKLSRAWLLLFLGSIGVALGVIRADQTFPATLPTTSASTLPLTPAATTQPLPTAQAVIDRYTEVTGGKDAYASIQSRHLEADYNLEDLGVKGKLVADIRRDANARLSIKIPDFDEVTIGVTDGVIWRNDQTNGPRILEGAEAQAMLITLRIAPEIELDAYESAEVIAITEVNGVSVYKMELLVKGLDSHETRYYDIKSGLLLRTDSVVQSNQDRIDVVTRFGDYEDVAPIRMPMKIRQSMSGLSPEQVNTKVEHNVDISDQTFALPPEVTDLINRRAATQPR